ncbi:molybdopterin molybdotransferase MoeA [Aquihabitans sp. G128]|uniref:molybdopterin molybdotransferase MoeA n=1 Tax=Aquihabitans sp. G128 TaxID=2849779 RepID=UPI001C2294D1|nr:gephyrin-like molybdotransferase Glp [Aquihabitans sp. G128]QXC63262.1 molybdopterin molybdotransferase MoeA [Aquihabitans sp. G128]
MIPFEEARQHVLDGCAPLAPAARRLDDALGAVLAVDATAPDPVPPFANSGMDGYAVRAADVAAASEQEPVRLRVAGTIAAGAPPDIEVTPGAAVRIMTGAPVPPGADAVVMVERSARVGDHEVDLTQAVPVGLHVRAAGSDVAAGELVLPAGTVLGPAHLGVLASVGLRSPLVVPRPQVGVISTGDELVDDDRPLGPGQIRESNRPTLVAALRAYGVDAVDLGTVADDHDALAAAITEAAAGHDAVATSGGVSMGDFDLVKVVLDEVADMRWMQVAIRPAKPFAFGVLDGTPVFGLPGNPVSSLVSLSLLGVPGLRRLAGRADLDLPRVAAVAGPGLTRRPDGRTAYLRVACRWDGTAFTATPVGGQGSHQLAATAGANGLAVLPDGDGVAEGAEVTVVLLADPFAP